MEGDPLADVLTLASARCVRIGTLKAGGTWALKFPPPQKIKLIAVVKGSCWLALDSERAPLRLQTGDVFMVPAARSYVLASDLEASQLDGLALFTKATDSVGTVGNGEDLLESGLCQNCVRYPLKPRSNTVIYGETPMHIVVARSR